MPYRFISLLVALTGLILPSASAGTKHSPASRFMSYEGRVMCGYQGWFRAAGDGSGEGWVHYTSKGSFEAENLKVDLWPDVAEYPATYPAALKMPDGSAARVFSSWDASTVDVHFRWMREYGIDGVFMQRFFRVTRTPESRQKGRVILGHALKASQAHGRALAVMYDLSGLKAEGEDCSSIIQDWKELVDELRITQQGADQTYLYHRGKPLVAIWGLGFPDRSYNIRAIGLEKLIDFLKNDPVYGGCSIMLGVPNYFRELQVDTLADPYLHEIIQQADVIMPWTVQRFTPNLHNERERFGAHVAADLAWCQARRLDYAPCVYPGFSWHNLRRGKSGGARPLDQIPRQGGRFY
ncbi:MAG: glycoside hydrolase family 71/99-like protein, partial [bacterium]|nr:glycoside hydrolase family 71/99-like protein [bacterium]